MRGRLCLRGRRQVSWSPDTLAIVDDETPSQTVAARLAREDSGGLLYGAIVTAAVLVAVGGDHGGVGRVVATWAFVLGTYWLAHVYVHTMESQLQGDRRHFLRRTAVAGRAEVAVLEGGIPAMAVYTLTALTDADSNDAARVALYFTVLLLAGFGYVGGRHAGRTLAASLGEALGASLLGVLMVIGKTLLH
jgi:hypothetical protein